MKRSTFAGDAGIADQDKFRSLSKEYSQLEEVTACFNAYARGRSGCRSGNGARR